MSITSTGKLKARGDFVLVDGAIVGGGDIELNSLGGVSISGILDVSGDPGGDIAVRATGDIALLSSSEVTGNGISSFVDERQRFADGAFVTLDSATGSIAVSGAVALLGANQAQGGECDLFAAGNITISQSVDVTGGGGSGGSVLAQAGDQIIVTRAIDASSRLGGGSGGDIVLLAGEDQEGGISVRGGIEVNDAGLKARGTSADQVGGDGGIIVLQAKGAVRVLGASVSISAEAATDFDGVGGYVALDSSDADSTAIGPLDGDVDIRVPVNVQGGNTESFGGGVDVVAGRDAYIRSPIDLGGTLDGGDLFVFASGAVQLNGAITAAARSADGNGGEVDVSAGHGKLAGLNVTKNIVASGGANNDLKQHITLAACSITVDPTIKVDGRAGTTNTGRVGGALLDLTARGPITLKASSQYLAGPNGRVKMTYPPGNSPVLEQGVVVMPTRVDNPVDPNVGGSPYPRCGQ